MVYAIILSFLWQNNSEKSVEFLSILYEDGITKLPFEIPKNISFVFGFGRRTPITKTY